MGSATKHGAMASVAPGNGLSAGDAAAARFNAYIRGVLVDVYKQDSDPDDTLAFARAQATGRPLLAGDREYLVSSIQIPNSVDSYQIFGVPGRTVIKRNAAGPGAWIGINAGQVILNGVIFDANKANITANQWCVLANGLVRAQAIDVRQCVFKNNSGTIGSGFSAIGANPVLVSTLVFVDNEITGCTWNPLYVASIGGGYAQRNHIHDNVGTSVLVGAYLSASASNYSSDFLLEGNRVYRATGGIQVGGIGVPYVYGTPSAKNCAVVRNDIKDIERYAIVCQGDSIDTMFNRISQSSPSIPVFTAIGYTGRGGRVFANTAIYVGASYGIDIGGSEGVEVSYNTLDFMSGGILNMGGGLNNRAFKNTATARGTAFIATLYEVEGDGAGTAFPYFCSGLSIEDNDFTMEGSGSRGVTTFNNPGGRTGARPTFIRNNRFVTTSGASDFYCVTLDSGGAGIRVAGNTVNGLSQTFVNPNGNGDIIVNDVWDEVATFSGAAVAIRSVTSQLLATYGANTSILWVYPMNGGSGYTASTVLSASSTGGGSGWTGQALFSQGAIVGVKTLTKGTGYSGTVTISASDSGGGTGATFSAVIAAAFPQDREIRLASTSVTNVLAASGGFVALTGAPAQILVPGNPQVLLKARTGNRWAVPQETKITFALANLPTAYSTFSGCEVRVTGSTTGKWQARCDGSKWVWPDGITVSV